VQATTNLLRAFDRFAEHWSPKIIADVNDSQVKIAKIKGEFLWHQHDTQDELFYVVRGSMVIRMRDRDVELEEGDLFVVPRGVEHQPVAKQEAWILLVEPQGTLNTGNVIDARTVTSPERL
jgi:mannose-6-phosphate isomerase-like protein (cupin superfamily)